MPSSTPKQARFFAAVAHGWKPDNVKAPPLSVARDFNKADTGTKRLSQGMRGKRKKMALGGLPGPGESGALTQVPPHMLPQIAGGAIPGGGYDPGPPRSILPVGPPQMVPGGGGPPGIVPRPLPGGGGLGRAFPPRLGQQPPAGGARWPMPGGMPGMPFGGGQPPAQFMRPGVQMPTYQLSAGDRLRAMQQGLSNPGGPGSMYRRGGRARY